MTNSRSRTYSPLMVALGVFLLPIVLYYQLPMVLHEAGDAFVQPDFHVELSIASSSLLLAFCIGGLAMALVQVFRTLIPFRGYFHEEQLRAWLGESLEDESPFYQPIPWWSPAATLLEIRRPGVHLALEELQRRDKNAPLKKNHKESSGFEPALLLYDLPIEQLSGQLNLAFEAAIDEPSRFANLLLLLLGPEGVPYLVEILPPPPPSPEQGQTQSGGVSAMKSSELEDLATRTRALKQAQARSSITRICQSRIDAFQIRAGGMWRRWLRLVVVAVSIGLSGAVCFTSVFRQPAKPVPFAVMSQSASSSAQTATGSGRGETAESSVRAGLASRIKTFFANLFKNIAIFFVWLFQKLGLLLYVLLIGVVAAYLAMLLRDLTAIVENKRRRA